LVSREPEATVAPPASTAPLEGKPARRPVHGSGRDLTTGSIPKNLWWLAWPQIVEGVLNVVDQIVDIIWAGLSASAPSPALALPRPSANLP